MKFQVTRSVVEGIGWPPLVNGPPAPLAALMHQMEATQWLAADELAQQQHQQLVRLAAHAVRFSPHFARRMQQAGLQAHDLGSREGLQRLPVMSRRELQSAGGQMFCQQVPQTHLPLGETRSSGSSGEPVVVKRTAISQLFWLANSLREHLWHERDFAGKLAIIRVAEQSTSPVDLPTWGPPASLFFDTGTSHMMPITTDVARQAEWLAELDPDYLLTYPTNLAALMHEFERRGIQLSKLRQLRTIGETLSDETRTAAQAFFNVGLADLYSSQEVGIVALQCPQSGLYHTMAESLLVEVLDTQGKPCAPCEVGRVVVTDLHNFVTPLVRYDIGDYAEVAAACPCGRGLPALKRIVGRERNMILLPDGRRHWPLVGAHHYREAAPVRQYQVIQRSRELLEVRLVVDGKLSAKQEVRLGEIIHKTVGYPFRLQFVYFEREIPRGKGGKFEEFICECGV